MITTQALLGYTLVAICWGFSNPFIKFAQANRLKDEEEDDEESSITKDHKSIFAGIKRLFSDKNMLIPFIFNQSGSAVFYYMLRTEPISIASPVVNALTFLITAVTSYAIFNEVVRHPLLLVIGTVFIITGTSLCMVS